MSSLTFLASAQEADSLWRLRVWDKHRLLRVEATIQFSDEPAFSCMDEGWRRVLVNEKLTQAENVFPLAGPLAYKIKDGIVTLGRTNVCDGYLFLTGPANGETIEGSYDIVGWGTKNLGRFTLLKIK